METKYTNTTAERAHVANTLKTGGSDVMMIPVRFRFPVEQTDDMGVVVRVKLVEDGQQLLTINPLAVKAWGLTDKEAEAAYHSAQEAIIKSVMIVNQ